MLLVKKGEEFKCWSCGRSVIINVRRDLYLDIQIRNMSKYCNLLTQSKPTLRANKTPLDNISRCSYCNSLVYEKISKASVGRLPDELFEI
jgi:hypothetical protein